MTRSHQKAFTLIELLIVVAIIAILAAIAVPNFLEAQVRSKVSRAKNDLRAIATGLEAYRTDNTAYPPDTVFYNWSNPPKPVPNPLIQSITTPIAYMTSLPKDVFGWKASVWNRSGAAKEYSYVSLRDWIGIQSIVAGPPKAEWALATYGPDQKDSSGAFLVFGEEYMAKQYGKPPLNEQQTFNSTYTSLYDATNGTMSVGDIARVGP